MKRHNSPHSKATDRSAFSSITCRILLLCFYCLATLTVLCQERRPPREIGIKLYNPAYFDLDNTANVTSYGQTGNGSTRFTLGGSGDKQIELILETTSRFLGSANDLKEFVERNGIFFDGNAASLIYELNPDLASISKIPRNEQIRVPVLQPPENLRPLTSPVIRLETDPTLKAQFAEDLEKFRKFLEKVENKKKLSSDVRGDLEAIDRSLGQIHKDELPISQQMLEQASAFVAELRQLPAKVPILNQSARQVRLIKEELHASLSAATRGNPNLRVTVKTTRGGKEISNFIVCYVAEALYKPDRCTLSFFGKSSPTSESLTEATYMFWAIEPGATTAVSDVRRMEISRQSDPLPELELTILKP